MELEFKVQPKKIKFTNIDGIEFFLRVPSMKEVQQIENDIRLAKPEDVIGLMTSYFQVLGLAEDEVSKLDADTYLDLFQFVNGAKKKI